jgi:hypothetical protein
MLLEEPHSVLLTLSSKAVQFRSLMLRGAIRLSSPLPQRRCDARWLSHPPLVATSTNVPVWMVLVAGHRSV